MYLTWTTLYSFLQMSLMWTNVQIYKRTESTISNSARCMGISNPRLILYNTVIDLHERILNLMCSAGSNLRSTTLQSICTCVLSQQNTFSSGWCFLAYPTFLPNNTGRCLGLIQKSLNPSYTIRQTQPMHVSDDHIMHSDNQEQR